MTSTEPTRRRLPAAPVLPPAARRRRRRRRPPSGSDAPLWLRAVALVSAATRALTGAAGAPGIAPAPAPAAGGAWGCEHFPVPPPMRLGPFSGPFNPGLEAYLGGAADARACHWGLDGAAMFGPSNLLLGGDGQAKALDIRALTPDDQARSAALASILGQAPGRLQGFAVASGPANTSTFWMRRARPAGQRADDPRFNVTLVTMSHEVALWANGSRAVYGDRAGLLAPLTRKLAVYLRQCVESVHFDTAADVFTAVVGNSHTQEVSAAATLEAALRAVPQRPVFATLALAPGYGGAPANASVEISTTGVRLHDATGALDLTLRSGIAYGLVGLDLERPPFTVELYNPLGTDGAADPSRERFHANATTLLLRLPLTGLGNGLQGTLTVAT